MSVIALNMFSAWIATVTDKWELAICAKWPETDSNFILDTIRLVWRIHTVIYTGPPKYEWSTWPGFKSSKNMMLWLFYESSVSAISTKHHYLRHRGYTAPTIWRCRPDGNFGQWGNQIFVGKIYHICTVWLILRCQKWNTPWSLQAKIKMQYTIVCGLWFSQCSCLLKPLGSISMLEQIGC